MQTAAIGYRVADFLEQRPPFNSIEGPDLLSLVSQGRVKLLAKTAPARHSSSVIQQGSISLWEEADRKEHLRDVRGPGEIIGIERHLGSQSSPYSAETSSDVVIYALQAADFEPLLERTSINPSPSTLASRHGRSTLGRLMEPFQLTGTEWKLPPRRTLSHAVQ